MIKEKVYIQENDIFLRAAPGRYLQRIDYELILPLGHLTLRNPQFSQNG
jgi:hypothetical protein